MVADPRIRASDDDRDRTAALREHHAVGRLSVEEFNERLDKVYAARTIGDLDELLADLPGIDLYRLPHASLPRYQAPSPHRPGPLPVPQAAGDGGGRGPVLPGLGRGVGVVGSRQRGHVRDLPGQRRRLSVVPVDRRAVRPAAARPLDLRLLAARLTARVRNVGRLSRRLTSGPNGLPFPRGSGSAAHRQRLWRSTCLSGHRARARPGYGLVTRGAPLTPCG